MPLDPWSLSSRDLLHLYSQTLTILQARGITRTRNPPAGDLAEWLVAEAYSGQLQPNSQKSYDVLTGDGRRIQVKSRALNTAGSAIYSLFRSWDFDACVFILFDPDTYDVTQAHEAPTTSLRPITNRSDWTAGDRVSVRTNVLALPGAVDVTRQVQAAQSRLSQDAGSTRPTLDQ